MNILVVNINNLKLTKALLYDIFAQTHPFNLTVIDNGSTQKGTSKFLGSFRKPNMKVLFNDKNVDLCRLWNDFYQDTKNTYLCFLNNDTRIPPNFVEDTVEVFNREPEVGCVVHAAGNPADYKNELEYKIPKRKFCQGWDFTIRREAYTVLPDDLKVYGGDDYIFSNLYLKGWKVAVVTSSPIIHYNAKSRRWHTGNRNEEMNAYLKYGYEPLPHGAHHAS